MRVKELTDLDDEEKSNSTTLRMPTELSNPGEALRPLLPTNHAPGVSLAPIDSSALVHSGWPWQGNIRFTNVSMRYNSESPLVLKGVTLTVPAGTTLGVVGRTGSGVSGR